MENIDQGNGQKIWTEEKKEEDERQKVNGLVLDMSNKSRLPRCNDGYIGVLHWGPI